MSGKTKFLFLAIVACYLLGCSSTPKITPQLLQEGASRFFIAQAAEIFYPDGVSANPGDFAVVDDTGAERINARLNAILDLIVPIHRVSADDLQAKFKEDIVKDPQVVLALTREGVPLAAVSIGPKWARIRMDVLTVQTIYRSVVLGEVTPILTGLPNTEQLAKFRLFKQSPMTEENEVLATRSFLSIIKYATTGEGPAPSMGDMQIDGFGKVDLGDDPEVRDLLLYQSLRQVEQNFIDIFGFIVAHELAHVVLRHAERQANDCDVFRELELEADIYATWLLGFFAGDRRDVTSSLLGFRDFFEYTYVIAGFEEFRTVEACEYPTVEHRAERLRSVASDIRIAKLMGGQHKWHKEYICRSKGLENCPVTGGG
jgi:hypothetical protein